MPGDDAPLISVAIPLYRSRPFVDCIARNIESIDHPSIEILISDRHQEDDALERLARRFAGDPRVRLLRARDRIGWVDHHNALLTAATGRYFLWMPHDDSYPAGYVSGLVACLEEQPQTILAFGSVQVVGEQGERLYSDDRNAALMRDGERRELRAALEVLMFHSQWLPQFHGVFRREPVVRAGLFVRPTADNVEADLYWVFGIGLLGEVRLVPSCTYVKRLHGANVSIGWGARRMRHVLDGFVVPVGYLRDAAPGARDMAGAVAVLALWTTLRAIGCLTQTWQRPSRQTRARVRRAVRKLVFNRRE